MKRIAVIGSIYRYLSHVQHIADRFLVGYPIRGTWHRPDMKIVSLYVDQKPDGDLSARTRQGVRLQGLSHHRRGSALRRRQTRRRRRADHRRARRLSAQREGPDPLSALRVLQAMSSTCSRRTAARFRSTTTSTFRTASRKRSGWWTRRSGCASRCWPAPRCRSPGGCRISNCRWAARSRKR